MRSDNNHIKTIPSKLKSDKTQEDDAEVFYRFMNEEHLKNHSYEDFSGDRIFNFSKEKIMLLRGIIDKEGEYELNKEILKELNLQSVNCSIILKTGNMNNSKANNRIIFRNPISKQITGDPVSNRGSKLDRPDIFIHMLNEFYKKDNLSIFSHSTNVNSKYLNKYLKDVGDVYKYCKEIYNLENKHFVNRVIDMGKRSLNNSENIYLYIKLAVDFWNCRIRYINSHINREDVKISEIELDKTIKRKKG